jgi:predicted ATPase
MLYRYTTVHNVFNFLDYAEETRRSRNVFTIVVGKNGTGKSRLLREIALNYLRSHGGMKKYADVSSREAEWTSGNAESISRPTKLICVSTSPFDKFPLIKRTGTVSYYRYLGLRGLSSLSMGLSYLAKIIYTLADAAAKSSRHSNAIGDVLEYLNYRPEINVTFILSSRSLLTGLLSTNNPREEIDRFTQRSGMFAGEYLSALRQLLEVDDRTFDRFLSAARSLAKWPARAKIEMQLNSGGITMQRDSIISPEDLVILGRFGMIKLKDVELQKQGESSPLMINEMSSGEQTVIMGLLGIGSQLENGALVCIDEPEVCLHPEWQERYIQLLHRVFSHYENCQFIIATHSPQIIAQLPNEGCYVMQVEDGIAHQASEFSKRSADFQLATVFKAPGFKNEYLTRIALNTFLEVAKTKEFSQENLLNFEILEESANVLSANDPLLELVNSIREMYKTYG